MATLLGFSRLQPFLFLVAMCFTSVAPSEHAQAPLASAELGQPDFTSSPCDNPLLSGNQQLCHPVGVVMDKASGQLFVADGDNNRVLIWPSATRFTNGEAAAVVLGHADFAQYGKCTGTTTPQTICDPNGLAIDSSGHLWVADTDDSRVIRFSPPFTSGMSADFVIGQRNLTTGNCGASANMLCHPRDLAFDQAGNLYAVDSDNNRVLIFKAPLSNSENASLVIGQADFSNKHCNRGKGPAADTLCGPKGIALDSSGNVYVAEDGNSRVLEYDAPINFNSKDISANRVYGEPDFSTVVCGLGATGVCHPDHVAIARFGQLIISDGDNNRLLVTNSPLTSSVANSVIGQPNFNSNATQTTANGLSGPKGIATDGNNNLYVTDEDNNRVLRFDNTP